MGITNAIFIYRHIEHGAHHEHQPAIWATAEHSAHLGVKCF